MAIPIANLSAIVTGALDAARAIATETLPAAVTRDAIIDASRATVAWLTSRLWAWLAVARAVAVDNLPAAASSAADASGPWIQTAAKLLTTLYGWLAAAVVQKLPDVAAEKLLGDAAAWLAHARGGGGGAVYATLAVVALLVAVAFVGGAVWALTCSPKRYFATARSARKAKRRAGGACCSCELLPAGILVAFAAYLAAKMLY